MSPNKKHFIDTYRKYLPKALEAINKRLIKATGKDASFWGVTLDKVYTPDKIQDFYAYSRSITYTDDPFLFQAVLHNPSHAIKYDDIIYSIRYFHHVEGNDKPN
jgi:hypothetical protein